MFQNIILKILLKFFNFNSLTKFHLQLSQYMVNYLIDSKRNQDANTCNCRSTEVSRKDLKTISFLSYVCPSSSRYFYNRDNKRSKILDLNSWKKTRQWPRISLKCHSSFYKNYQWLYIFKRRSKCTSKEKIKKKSWRASIRIS